MRLLTAIILGLLLLVGVSACGRGASSAAAAPTNPNEVRLVAFSPAIAVMLRDLGYERQIVGRHAYDLVLDPSVPSVGDQGAIDYETLVRLHPTHVYTQFGEAGVPEHLRTLAAKHHWALEDYRLRTLDDIATTLDDLALDLRGLPGLAPGELDPAERFRGHEQPSARLANAWADRGPTARAAGRVLLLAPGSKPGVLGPGSVHQQLLVRMGATPAVTEGASWIDLDAEDVVRLAPDAIILFVTETSPANEDDRFVEPEPKGFEAAKARLGALANLPIPAIQHKRVAVIEHPLALLPSSSLAEIADEMGKVFDRWAAEDRAPTTPKTP